MNTADNVEPTGADRETAAQIMETVCEIDGGIASFDAFRRGEEDNHPVVQLVARNSAAARAKP